MDTMLNGYGMKNLYQQHPLKAVCASIFCLLAKRKSTNLFDVIVSDVVSLRKLKNVEEIGLLFEKICKHFY